MYQTVRALAGEGGEVGGKALALLERWKQLVSIDFHSLQLCVGTKLFEQVMSEGGAETLTPPEPEAWHEGLIFNCCKKLRIQTRYRPSPEYCFDNDLLQGALYATVCHKITSVIPVTYNHSSIVSMQLGNM